MKKLFSNMPTTMKNSQHFADNKENLITSFASTYPRMSSGNLPTKTKQATCRQEVHVF